MLNNKITKQLLLVFFITLISTVIFNSTLLNLGFYIDLFHHYQEISLDLSKGEMKDLSYDQNCYTTTSNDAWILFRDINVPVSNVEINAESNNSDYITQIFYSTMESPYFVEQHSSKYMIQNEESSIRLGIPQGTVVKDLRIDLTDLVDSRFYIDAITLNAHRHFALKPRTLFYSFIILFFVVLYSSCRWGRSQELAAWIRERFSGKSESVQAGKRMEVQHIFLVLALSFGLLFVFLTPPMQSPDEGVHFINSYLLYERQVLPVQNGENLGNVIPVEINKFVQDSKYMPFHADEKYSYKQLVSSNSQKIVRHEMVFTEYSSICRLVYFPQAIGMRVARETFLLFDNVAYTPALLLYFGRTFNLLFFIICVYFAIKRTPVMKNVFLLLALLPMTLFQAASVSYDVFINGTLFLLFAIILDYRYRKESSVKLYELALLAALFALIMIIKPVYAPLSLLIFLIPKEKIKQRNLQAGYIWIAFIVVSAAIYLMWNIVIGKALSGWAGTNSLHNAQQFDVIRHAPLTFLRRVLLSLKIMNYEISIVGVLGWLDTFLPSAFYLIALLVLIAAVVIDKPRDIGTISIRTKAFVWVLAACSMMLIITALYLGFSPINSDYVYGVQGRYLIPLSPMFLLLFVSNTASQIGLFTRMREKLPMILTSVVVFQLGYTAFILMLRYWIV